jgi:uncharacterized membrane protein YagU involved in acid resistance
MVEPANTANTEAGSEYRASMGARLEAGIASGIVGGILTMGFMMTYADVTGAGLSMPLKALGAFVYGVEALVAGPAAMLVGALIEFGFLIVLGILFALVISRGASTVAALFAGMAIGIAIWVAMELMVLPFMNPTMAARVALMPLAYFIAHLLFGFGLATTPIFIRAFSKERRPRRSVRAAQTQPI